MFQLRRPHLDAFEKAARESFEDRMLPHVQSRYSEQCARLGEEKVRERILDGLDRARQYDIRNEPDVAAFIRLTFGLRPDFDTSPKTAWAGEILRKTDVPAGERMARIKKYAREHRAELR